MFGRQALRSIWRSGGSSSSRCPSGRRWYADTPPPPGEPSEEFMALWKKVLPNTEMPKTPAGFMTPRPPVPTSIPEKLTVNFVLPYEVPMNSEKVDMVILPATAGMMGVLPGHVPTIAELKPGVLSVHEGGQLKTQYFLSSGFAFIHSNSVTDIVAVEAAPLDRFEPDEVRKSLADYQQKLAGAKDDLERAQAQIGIEVFSTLASALNVH